MADGQDQLDFLINNCLGDTFADARIARECHELKVPKGPVLAIVIDDLGEGNPARTDQAISLPSPLTMAFIPASGNPRLQEQVKAAYDKGHEIIMHTPMQTGTPSVDTGEHRLMDGQSQQQIEGHLWANKQAFGETMQYFSGFNNHQGSQFTRNLLGMEDTINYFDRTTDMQYVLDSRTHAGSKVCEAAQGADMACVSRDVFLDHVNEEDAVRAKLYEAVDKAIENGSAIAIGHHYTDTTLKVLAEEIPRIQNELGVTLVPVSDVVERQSYNQDLKMTGFD